MKMIYGGYLPLTGTFTDKKTGKDVSWHHIKVLLSPDGARSGVYKAPYSDDFIKIIRAIPVGTRCDVFFDFYGNVENIMRCVGGSNHD